MLEPYFEPNLPNCLGLALWMGGEADLHYRMDVALPGAGFYSWIEHSRDADVLIFMDRTVPIHIAWSQIFPQQQDKLFDRAGSGYFGSFISFTDLVSDPLFTRAEIVFARQSNLH